MSCGMYLFVHHWHPYLIQILCLLANLKTPNLQNQAHHITQTFFVDIYWHQTNSKLLLLSINHMKGVISAQKIHIWDLSSTSWSANSKQALELGEKTKRTNFISGCQQMIFYHAEKISAQILLTMSPLIKLSYSGNGIWGEELDKVRKLSFSYWKVAIM